MPGVFKFKQFDVNQAGCAMKINTDGVLLGALAEADNPATILDIGTGTGVIALMLAQRFTSAKIDAVEIDSSAAKTASQNFSNSPFADRLELFDIGFEDFFGQHPEKKYDMIVSNPPFYINSLKSPKEKMELAKHTDKDFFQRLLADVSKHLNVNGLCYLILRLDTAKFAKRITSEIGLFIIKVIKVYSYIDSEAHREILILSPDKVKNDSERFIIYDGLNVYSKQYESALKNFFTIF